MSKLPPRSLFLGASLWLLACEKQTTQPVQDATTTSCTVNATVVYQPIAKTMTGGGAVSCSAAADLVLKVCLYGKSSADTTWGTPIQCTTSGGSGRTTLSAETATSIAIGGTRDYRASADAKIDSVDQPTQYSAVVSAP